jgi:hypothetical protein
MPIPIPDKFIISWDLRIFNFPPTDATDISLITQATGASDFIQLLWETGILTSDSLLKVFGGGMAGVSAAISAAKAGIPVILHETEEKLFAKQANCKTRWLDPTEYSWPQDSWDRGTCEIGPFQWRGGLAHKVAENWSAQFHEIVRDGELSLKCLFNFPRLTYEGFLNYVESDSKQNIVYLLALGFMEHNRVADFASIPYWSSDPFTHISCGCPQNKPRVLISGGANGGLQESIRMLTRRSAGAVLERLDSSLNHLQSWKELLHTFKNASGPQPDFDRALQNAETFIESASDLDLQIFQELLRPLEELTHLHLVHKSDSFSSCFPLNRLLITLFHKYCRKQGLSFFVIPNRETVGIVSEDTMIHSCQTEAPQECLCKPHKVTFQTPSGTKENDATYDIILIRHGLKFITLTV